MDESLKKKLLKDLENLERQLAAYKSEDPLLDPEQTVSNTMDDAVTVAEGHDRIVAIRLGLKQRLVEVKEALAKIDKGAYGLCENCGKKISEARLKVLPTARLCLECESQGQVGDKR